MSEYSLQWNSILHDFEIISLCADATTYCGNVWSVTPRRDQFLYCLHSVFLIGRKQSKRAYQTNGRFHRCSYAYMSVYQESGIKNQESGILYLPVQACLNAGSSYPLQCLC